MQEKRLNKDNKSTNSKGRIKTLISIIVIAILIPATILLSSYMGDRNYYIAGVIIVILSMIPFFIGFESRKPQAREVVTIAVMTAIAVVSRVAFIMLPSFKPLMGIVMMTGIALGPAAGFLTGSLSAFVSNFIFGQGAWTPWQMFAFGMGGLLAALLHKAGIMKLDKWKHCLISAIIGGLLILVIVGPLLDTCSLFIMATRIGGVSAGAIYLAGIPVNLVHGLAVALTLLLLGKPIKEKLDRIKIKYGMIEPDYEENLPGSSK